MTKIEKINPDSAISAWNHFLSRIPASQVPFSFNPSLFNFYIRYFHWKPYYLILSSNDEDYALFPLVDTGRKWVSLPHFSYGGFIAKPESRFQADEQMLQKLISLMQSQGGGAGFYRIDTGRGSEYFEKAKKKFIRTIQSDLSGIPSPKVSSFLNLSGMEDGLFESLKSNLRRKINKAANAGFDLQIGGEELLNPFYKVYSSKVHRLGSPAYGRKFFLNLIQTYRFGDAKIFLVRRKQKILGASLLLSYNGFYESVWFATCKEAYRDYISDFLHWNMITYALSKRAEVYSFGRSTVNGSVHRFKSHWPVEDIPIQELGNNPVRDLVWLSKIWKRVPFPIANRLGPILVKHIY